jgi:hypothetical protein
LTLTSFASAQEDAKKQAKPQLSEKHRIPDGSKVYIEAMEGELHTHLAANMTKKKLPVVLVTDKNEADYVIIGAALKRDDKWHQTVFGTGRDRNEGSIQVFSTKDRAMVWAGEAGDYNRMWGRLAKGGKGKIASRLVTQMKKHLFWKEKTKTAKS